MAMILSSSSLPILGIKLSLGSMKTVRNLGRHRSFEPGARARAH